VAIDWVAVGGAAVAIITGVGGWFAGRGKRETGQAEDTAERDVIVLMRQEVERISNRLVATEIKVQALEMREIALRRHILLLESMIRDLGKDPPAFEFPGWGDKE
jgi:hypothetical protein